MEKVAQKLWNALKNAAGVGFSVHWYIQIEVLLLAGSKVAHGLGSVAKGATIGLESRRIGGLGIAGIKAGIDYGSAFAGVKKP